MHPGFTVNCCSLDLMSPRERSRAGCDVHPGFVIEAGWKTFLSNHREVIAAMDFFTVPTLTFGLLYCFFVIAHDRRRILHFNVTRHPNSFWIAQQMREAFPDGHSMKYLIFDRDAQFGCEVLSAVEAIELASVRTSFKSPWQ